MFQLYYYYLKQQICEKEKHTAAHWLFDELSRTPYFSRKQSDFFYYNKKDKYM